MPFRSPWKNPDTGTTYNIGQGGKATEQNPMKAYFTQLADPRYRQAMQQQNLFSNLLNFGAQMSAAGAPSLDPGYAGRTRAGALAGLGKGLMSGNQAYRNQMMNAMKLKSMMDTSNRAKAMHDVDLKTKQIELARLERIRKLMGTPSATDATPPTEDFGIATVPSPPPQFDTNLENQLGCKLTQGEKIAIQNAKDPDAVIQKFIEARRPDPSKEYTIGGDLTPKGIAAQEAKWRMELKPQRQMAFDIKRKMDMVESQLALKTGQGDIAAMTAYIKMIDDGIVRTEDVNLQKDATSLKNRLVIRLEGLKKGVVWDEPTREKILQSAREVANSQIGLGGIASQVEGWKNVVERTKGLNWRNVWPEQFDRYITARKPNRPKVGSTPTEKKHNLPSPIVGGT